MFSGKFLESNQNVVHIKDINNEVMHHLIDFIYTGILVTLDEDNVEVLIFFSQRLYFINYNAKHYTFKGNIERSRNFAVE